MEARRGTTVAIRVDSGTQIGSGHLMRCLCLTRALDRAGCRVRFLCREMPGELSGLIEREGYPVIRFAAEHPWSRDCMDTSAAVAQMRADWLIVDHYGIGAQWERPIRETGVRILVIDDLADRPHDCDVLLDQNYAGRDTQTRYRGLVNESCRLMLGPRYALLQPEYARLRSVLVPRRKDPRRVLVFFGGTDATNETGKALRALATPELAHLAVDVVLGANHPAPAEITALAQRRPGTTLHRNLPTLAGLMFRADLAIGAGGITTLERLCLGLPSVVVTVAPNQERPISSLAEEGAVLWAGRAETVTEKHLAVSIRAAVADPPVVPQLVDGRGAARVGAVIAPPAVSRLRLMRAGAADARLLFDWRNEARAREMSFDAEPIAWGTHMGWLERKLLDTSVSIYIGEVDGLPVGYARLETDGSETVVSYGVDADFRGLGFGKALVRSAVRGAPPPVKGFRAHVKARNEFSKKIFRGLGWHETITEMECIYCLGSGELNGTRDA